MEFRCPDCGFLVRAPVAEGKLRWCPGCRLVPMEILGRLETLEGLVMRGFWGLRAWGMDPDVLKFQLNQKAGYVIDRTGPSFDGLLPSYVMVLRPLEPAQ